MRKRGKISSVQAEKLRQALPTPAKPEKQPARSGWPKGIAAAIMPTDTNGSELVFEKDGHQLGLPLKKTDVQIEIHTDVARVFVTQLFLNPTEQVLEARYTFPLPHPTGTGKPFPWLTLPLTF